MTGMMSAYAFKCGTMPHVRTEVADTFASINQMLKKPEGLCWCDLRPHISIHTHSHDS